jgi:tRNA threonylcarbamoyladenosine biosynthesis protein TsaE
MTETFSLPEPGATDAFAERLVDALGDRPAGWLIALKGELGAGKSTLARAMLRAYGHDGAVPSPTYTLIEPYSFPGFDAYHVDLYRIADPEELDYLGWSDLSDGLCLVEWPERAPGLEARADLVIELSYAGEGRAAALRAGSDRGAELLERISLK